jgi:hypothetical protein
MSFLAEVQLPESFGPFVTFREKYGFIPRLLRAQTLLPASSRLRRSWKALCS